MEDLSMADNNDVSLQAEVRTGTGKGEAKRIRRTGRIPAVVYGDRSASVACTVEAKALSTVLHEHGRNTLLALVLCNGEGKSEDTAIVKDLQHHPVDGHLLHVDFYRISLTQKIVVEVRIEPEGIPPASARRAVFWSNCSTTWRCPAFPPRFRNASGSTLRIWISETRCIFPIWA
jgi:ribosomal protein bL25 (Ctc-form)